MTKWLDRLFYAVLALAAVGVLGSWALITGYAPIDRSMWIVQKIFYTHVPAAMAAYAGFTVTSACSLFYLMRPHRRWDVAAVTGAELGLLFCGYVLISGPLWAVKAWGRAWTWDPQLTATFVLFLLYGAYLALRRLGGDDNETIRQVAAVIACIAFVDIPIIHYAVQQWGGMHPVVERSGGGGLAPAMKTTFSISMVAFLLLFVAVCWLSIRIGLTRWRLDDLYIDVADARRRSDNTDPAAAGSDKPRPKETT
jgi:heme exporter protein C